MDSARLHAAHSTMQLIVSADCPTGSVSNTSAKAQDGMRWAIDQTAQFLAMPPQGRAGLNRLMSTEMPLQTTDGKRMKMSKFVTKHCPIEVRVTPKRATPLSLGDSRPQDDRFDSHPQEAIVVPHVQSPEDRTAPNALGKLSAIYGQSTRTGLSTPTLIDFSGARVIPPTVVALPTASCDVRLHEQFGDCSCCRMGSPEPIREWGDVPTPLIRTAVSPYTPLAPGSLSPQLMRQPGYKPASQLGPR